MTVSDFAVGWALLALWTAAPATAAVLLRRRLLAGWTGARAVLVDVVATLALVLAVAQLLGTAGGLTRAGMTAGTLLAGAAGTSLALRLPTPEPRERAAIAQPLWSCVVGLLAVAALVGVWVSHARSILAIGDYDTDSLVYHWPYAASFAQSGWTTRIHLGAPGGGVSWHAANAELVGGISILAFHRDWLLPLLNFGWLALLLLAAWVVGHRRGVSGLTTAAACSLLAVPVMSRSQGGTGFTDTASLALVLAAVALLVEAFEDDRTALLFSGTAAGLAASTKETTLATVAVMGLAVLVLSLRSRRVAGFVLWAAPAALLGSFWYVRNLVREDNPLPTSHLGPFRSVAGPLIDRYGYSVADQLTNGHVIRHIFLPGLHTAWGVAWPALVVGALLAAGLAMRRSAAAHDRALAVIGVVGLLAYLVTPTTAYGLRDRPVLFPQNTRYALPAMLVLLVLLARLVGNRTRVALGAALVLVLLATIASRGAFATILPQRGLQALEAAAVAGVAIAVVWLVHRRLGWRPVAVLALLSLPLLYVVGRDYEQNRYAPTAGDAARTFDWASQVHGVHIGLDGISEEYPYVGRDVSNRVSYIGLRDAHRVFSEVPSCALWRQVVNAGGFDYVVTGPHLNGADLPVAARWVDPAAMVPVLTAGAYHVYRVTGRLDPQTCPAGA